MKNKKFSLGKLFFNDRFVLIFSVFAAMVIWIAVAINVSPETERVVKNVKVTIDTKNSVPAQLGLKAFGDTEYTVDVTVVGKKYLVSPTALTADDIVVAAITENVTTAGINTLELKATSADHGGEFKITSLSKRNINVYFDVEKTKEFSIKPDIVASGNFSLTEDGFKTGTPLLSVSTVTVTGPETELSKVNSVVARATVSSTLHAATTLDAEVLILDAKGKESFKYLSMNYSGDLSMTVPVVGTKNLGTSVTFKNATNYYLEHPLPCEITPSSGNFDVSIEEFRVVKTALVGTIDFKELSVSKNTFTFPTSNLTDIVYNGKASVFSVTVDMTGMEQRKFTVPLKNISIINKVGTDEITIPDGLNTEVTIVGPAETISLLTTDNIFAEIDLQSEVLEPGDFVRDARVYTSNTTCWAYGTYTCKIEY